MLIEFGVENFSSFRAEQVLTFRATADRAHEKTHRIATHIRSLPHLVRSAVLVGPNAVGKTNLVAALQVLRTLVIHSNELTAMEFAALFTPFDGGKDGTQPTFLSIDLVLEEVRYQLRVGFDRQRIVYEALAVSVSKKSQRWYTRTYDAATDESSWGPFSAGLRGPRSAWMRATRPRTLLLSTAARLNAVQLQPLLSWFENDFAVILETDVPDMAPFAQRLEDPHFKARALGVLQSLDIPALDVRVSERKVHAEAAVQIEFKSPRHGGAPAWIQGRQFSSGAHRLVRLLALLLSDSQRDRFVAIDEFDTHLHPMVTRRLVQSLNESPAYRHLQLLAVTHTASLLDLDILRRDEIWLMHADPDHASRLARLSQYSPRRDESIARGYLRGRYDSVPQFKTAIST
jgi:hypothetical protein